MGRSFCGMMAVRTEDAKWNKSHLRWFLAGGLPGVLQDAFRQETVRALKLWSGAANLTFEEVASKNSADVLMATGPIDGPGGTLAWSMLPPANPIDQKYDTGEDWGRTPLWLVIAHEWGHALGLDHDGRNSGSLMAPMLNARMTGLGSRDVARIQQLYGPPQAPPPLPPPGEQEISIVLKDGKVASAVVPGFRVTPLA